MMKKEVIDVTKGGHFLGIFYVTVLTTIIYDFNSNF